MIIKRVGPFSVAKVAGTLYAIFGLIIGACVSLIALIGGMAADDGPAQMFGALFGVGAIVFFPLFYGIGSFLVSLFMAWLYNVVAGMVGGFEIET